MCDGRDIYKLAIGCQTYGNSDIFIQKKPAAITQATFSDKQQGVKQERMDSKLNDVRKYVANTLYVIYIIYN